MAAKIDAIWPHHQYGRHAFQYLTVVPRIPVAIPSNALPYAAVSDETSHARKRSWMESRIMRTYMTDLVFEAVQEADGGYCAECLTENIFTQGDTWDELRRNVIDATAAFFFDQPRPGRVRLHLVKDEVLSIA